MHEQAKAQRSNWPSDDVQCIIEDREGNLWVGTGAGLCMLDPGRKRVVTYRNIPGDSMSIAGNSITALKEDSHGIIWIGTTAGIKHT